MRTPDASATDDAELMEGGCCVRWRMMDAGAVSDTGLLYRGCWMRALCTRGREDVRQKKLDVVLAVVVAVCVVGWSGGYLGLFHFVEGIGLIKEKFVYTYIF